jgi:hypothetical protein
MLFASSSPADCVRFGRARISSTPFIEIATEAELSDFGK